MMKYNFGINQKYVDPMIRTKPGTNVQMLFLVPEVIQPFQDINIYFPVVYIWFN